MEVAAQQVPSGSRIERIPGWPLVLHGTADEGQRAVTEARDQHGAVAVLHYALDLHAVIAQGAGRLQVVQRRQGHPRRLGDAGLGEHDAVEEGTGQEDITLQREERRHSRVRILGQQLVPAEVGHRPAHSPGVEAARCPAQAFVHLG
jgi:hypothetical protein